MYLVTTTSHGGRRWYLRRGGSHTTDRGAAWCFTTSLAAASALARKRLACEIDSAWHHGTIITLDR